MTSAGRTIRRTEIIARTCAQCGFGEAVCEIRDASPSRPQFTTCPRCGFTEEVCGGHTRCWRGHGVYVLQSETGVVKAGTFPEAVPDSKVPTLVAKFLELGPAVRYVSRWNEAAGQLEVLIGNDE